MRFSFISHFLNLLILSGLMVACAEGSSSDEPIQREDAPIMAFTITLSSENTATRADNDWENNDKPEEGTYFDNLIRSVEPVIYAVDENGELITDTPAGYMAGSTLRYDNNGRIIVTGPLVSTYTLSELEEGNFRIAVFVNADDVPFSSPASTRFERFGAPSPSFNCIPMYGVGKANFKGIAAANPSIDNPYMITSDAEGSLKLDIPLLRAMAKIRVKVDPQLIKERDMKLISLSLSRHPRTGFVVPAGWNTVTSTEKLPIEGSFNLCQEGTAVDNPIVPGNEDNSGERNTEKLLRFFVPDTHNADITGALDPNELALTVRYVSDGEEEIKGGRLYFREYKSGAPDVSATARPWNLVRNHIYEYTITGIAPKAGTLYVTVDTSWWGEHHLDLED